MSNKKNHTWETYPDNILTEDMKGVHFFKHILTTTPTNLHYHTQFELGLCLAGHGVIYIQNDVYPYEAGDVSVIFPGENHIGQSAKNAPGEWIFITLDTERLFAGWSDSERLKKLYTRERGESRILDPIERGTVIPYLHRMIALHEDNSLPEHDKIGNYAALAACILYESAKWKRNKATLSLTPEDMIVLGCGKEIYPAIQYIFAHYTENVTADQLCRVCGISPMQMRRLFCATVGMSPMAFLHKIRISHACGELSSTKLLVQVVAENCGYTTLSSFNRQFQKIMQMSPNEYRAAHKEPT